MKENSVQYHQLDILELNLISETFNSVSWFNIRTVHPFNRRINCTNETEIAELTMRSRTIIMSLKFCCFIQLEKRMKLKVVVGDTASAPATPLQHPPSMASLASVALPLQVRVNPAHIYVHI